MMLPKPRFLPIFILILLMTAFLSGCGKASSSGASSSGAPGASNTTNPSNSATLLVWDGAGANPIDLGCLLAQLTEENVPMQLVTSDDLAAMTETELAGYLGLVFPDGSTSEALASLPTTLQQELTDAVNTYGLHMVASGASSGIPGQLGLIPTTSSFWSSLIQIAEVILEGISLFFPQAAIVSQFLNGLPAIVQLSSQNGIVSLFGPETTNPSCGSTTATNPAGGSANVNALETLIQLIQTHAVPAVRVR